MKPLPSEKHWKVKPLSRKWSLEKNTEKSETVINTCVSTMLLTKFDIIYYNMLMYADNKLCQKYFWFSGI